MNSSQRVAKNTAWMLFGGGLGTLLSTVAVLLAARGLALSEFGTFNYLLSFATVFQFLADFGLTNILVREVARRPDDVGHLLASAKGLMWTLFLSSTLILLGVVFLINLPLRTQEQSFVMGIASLTLLQAISYSAVLRAIESMEFNAIGFTLHKGCIAAFIGISLVFHLGLWGVVYSYLAASLVFWFFNWRIVAWRVVRVTPRIDLPLWKSMLAEAIPLGSGLILRQFSGQADVLILMWLVDPSALGLFSGPYRILLSVRTFSMAFALPLYPALIRTAQAAKEDFTAFYNRAMKWFCCLSMPGTVLLIVWPQLIISVLLGPKFLVATTAMRWFGLAFVPMFVTSLSPFVFTALGRQGVFCLAMIVTLILRVGADLAFVPMFGFVGGAAVAATNEILALVILNWILARKGYPLHIADFIIKPSLAGLLMAGVLFPARNMTLLPALPFALVGGLVYVGALFLLRAFSSEELRLMKDGLGFFNVYLRRFRAREGEA